MDRESALQNSEKTKATQATRGARATRATNGARLFSKADYLIFLLVLVSCVAAFVMLPPLGLSSSDEGARYIQMKNFALYGTLPIEYPGYAAGLRANDVAKDQDVFIERGERLYITYPPLFTYLSSLAYPLVGDRVTTLLPLLAVFFCVVIMAATLKILVQRKPFYYVLLFGFLLASPVYSFGVRFVEHVPAVCLVLLSLYFLVRYFRVKASLPNLCLSVSLLSAGVFFRSEVILLAIPFAAYVSVTLCVQREVRKAGVVLACSVVPILLYAFINYRLYGSTLLLHLLYNSLGFHLSRGQTVLALGALFLSGLLAYLTRKGSEDPLLRERVYAFIPVLFISFLLVASSHSPVPALFLAFPLVLFTFFATSGRGEKLRSEAMSLGNILFVTVTSFLVLVSWLFADNSVGNLGYSLAVIPFVILLVAQEEQMILSSKPMVALVLVLLVFSACYSAYSSNSVTWRYKRYNAERTAFLKAQTKPGGYSAGRFTAEAGAFRTPLFRTDLRGCRQPVPTLPGRHAVEREGDKERLSVGRIPGFLRGQPVQ